MEFPTYRSRRLRRNETLRRMVRETRLSVDQLILPLFVVPGSGVVNPIGSMPDVAQLSVDKTVEECRAVRDLGIPAVILFGIPEKKDTTGSHAYRDDGVVPRAVAAIKKAVPDLMVITDVCLCEYTDHGHCGVLVGEEVDTTPRSTCSPRRR
jgi:porphobilinogen synthase